MHDDRRSGEWAGRDTVFVSYSRADAEWMQAFRVMLTPGLEKLGIKLWVDEDIQPGDPWDSRIEQGIERSGVALLLVSKDFLASDYIREQELPALVARGVRLAPVLVGSCMYTTVEEFVGVQWLHDPGREGALNLVAERPGERDRRIWRACENLMALLPPADLAQAFGPEAPSTDPSIKEVPVEAIAGRLSGVPAPPPGYVARDELAGLIEAISAVETGAVGVTGRCRRSASTARAGSASRCWLRR
jgi:TIR domain